MRLIGRNSNLLVAAAAGSGKTAVLVERIIRRIIDDSIDIDKILVVTFTNAAASEMRERILNALYKEIEKDPLNIRLRKQIILLNKANICTIDAFCLDVIRNNFFEIDISSNFRIADNVELELLKQESIEEVFEEMYLANDIEFNKLVDIYAGYKDDENLKTLILKIYNFIQSDPFPEEWLENMIKQYEIGDVNNLADTKWGKLVIHNFKDELENAIQVLNSYKNKLENDIELQKFFWVIEDDIRNLNELQQTLDNWDILYEKANSLKFKSWPVEKKTISNLKDEAKLSRDNVKKRISKAIDDTFVYKTSQAIEDINFMHPVLVKIKEVIDAFTQKFREKKNAKNILDFSDIEHYALKILLTKNEDGEYIQTDVAKRYQEKFEEIAIDEYQDSNLVQEKILTSISRNNNIFMVGDVKQSIYRFRQAKPELFMDKYEKYSNEKDPKGQKIKLFKNFRSRENVLDFTNLIFDDIMSKDFGEIEYDESEFLNVGASFETLNKLEFTPELYIIDKKQNEAAEADEDNENIEVLEKTEIEARFVAKKIKQLIDNQFQVSDKEKGNRKIEYKDIVILLRATQNVATIFEKELNKENIPVFSDQAENYLDSIEIKTVISLLKVIDNPYRDIALVTVMRSIIGDFSDNELTEIRLINNEGYFFDSMVEALKSDKIAEELKNKISCFITKIEKWREEEKYTPLNEFLINIFNETDYYNYVRLMVNGEVRRANLDLLVDKAKDYEKISFKGLFNFIKYLDKVKAGNTDLQAAKIIGENENVVRIMSIHKSKGLEFPVVFLARADKKFNQRDLSDSILLHQDLGFGLQYSNSERKIEYTTLPKEAIKIKVKEESIAEEMRILYVALTRAKEKLFITGVEEDLEKSLDKKKEQLQIYKKEKYKINHLLLKKYLSYLGWIELVYLSHDDINDYITLNKIDNNEIDNDKTEENADIYYNFADEYDLTATDIALKWSYEYNEMTNLQSKMSVTKIKQLMQNEDEYVNNEIKPKFINDESVSASEIGTAVHLILQKIDFNNKYTKESLHNFIIDLQNKKYISESQIKNIKEDKLLLMLESELGMRLKSAKKIMREIPFYTYVDTKDVYHTEKSENILVQGIIDLYFIDENGSIVLVDYKTDFVKNDKELVDKYKIQLDLYKKALEEAIGKTVNEVYIYSIYLNKSIKVS